jgi:hypothetical protein
VAGVAVEVDGWTGSQNHNWGSRHTDRYAFGQVAGFDNAPASFLEVATARNRVGPLWTPELTPMVLRHNGHEYALTSVRAGLRARSSSAPGVWTFGTGRSRVDPVKIRGRITAPPEAFVTLEYRNPPGGTKQCLNTKLAACELEVTDRATGTREVLASAHGALFEILT